MRSGITVVRTFAASPDRVFAAWTEGAQLVRWFAPPGFTGTATCDARVGGTWSSETGNADVPHLAVRFHGVYREVEAPTRLAFTLCVPDEPGEELVTVDLVASAAGTEMTFTQGGGSLPPEEYVRAASGWEMFFSRLDALVSD
ncbi:MAG: SRPBCC family protein [Gaiellales bacterium]